MKILLPGGAGLVGQNLIVRLKDKGYKDIVVLDKHKANLAILKKLHPQVKAIYADLAKFGDWQKYFIGADVVVMLQAQIGGNNYQDFVRNNIDSTRHILNIVKAQDIPNLVHVSSSVVESEANDYYTNTKKAQEDMVLESGIPAPILRPTLMFGWFDRKHLGWLSRFMKKIPIFPIPGNGKYMRQPLYSSDFCNIIISCIENNTQSGRYNISGHENIDYIDMIFEIKKAINSKTWIVKIPYSLFYFLLWIWALFDKNPPFTTQQLKALTTNDEFEVIDWPNIFNVQRTPFSEAIDTTFNSPVYSKIVLDF